MKTLPALVVALSLPACLFADDTATVTAQPKAVESPTPATVTTETKTLESAPPARVAPDRFVMASGSVLSMHGAEGSRLTSDVKLADGTVLSSGGTVMRSDGSQSALADGQSISINGKLGPIPAAASTTGATIQVVKP